MSRDDEEGQTKKDQAETWLDRTFEPFFYQLRYVILIPIIASFLGALMTFWLGIYETYVAFTHLISLDVDPVIVHVLKAIDIFLLGLVLAIFSYGVYDLFISRLEPARSSEVGPDWISFNNVSQLKLVIVEVVIVILVILFFEVVKANIDTFDDPIELLIIPIGALFIAIGVASFKRLTHE